MKATTISCGLWIESRGDTTGRDMIGDTLKTGDGILKDTSSKPAGFQKLALMKRLYGLGKFKKDDQFSKGEGK
jgi:hypothetical protein